MSKLVDEDIGKFSQISFLNFHHMSITNTESTNPDFFSVTKMSLSVYLRQKNVNNVTKL